MKKYFTLLSAILIITSCDIVEGPYLTDEAITPIDTTTNSYVKKVLVEDFTGHLCPNCPDAARELDAIHGIYGDQLMMNQFSIKSLQLFGVDGLQNP